MAKTTLNGKSAMQRSPIDRGRPFTAHADPTMRGELAVLDVADLAPIVRGKDIPVLVIPQTAECVKYLRSLLAGAIGAKAATDALNVLGIEERS